MKRRFDEAREEQDEQANSDIPRSRASGFTDQELESRFSSSSSKLDGGELMDEATIKKMMREERENAKRGASPPPQKKKASRWENRRVQVDDSEVPFDAGSLLRSPSPDRQKSSPESRQNQIETDARASAGAAASLSPGDLVSLKGLQAAAHLNGEKGRLVRLDQSSGRWEVRLLKTAESKAIKPDNIILEDSDDEDDDPKASDTFVPPKSPEPSESDPPVAPKSPPLSAHTPPLLSGRAGIGGVAGLSSISQIGAVGLPTVAQRFDAIPLARKSSSKPSKPARQMGTIRWYNGRRKLGVIISDDGGKELFIPAQGASNGSQVPPQPGGLFHGTRVSFVPTAIKAESSSSTEKKIVCMDVRALAGQVGLTVGVDTFVGGKEKNDDRIAAMDLHELGFLAGIFDGHHGPTCADFVSKQVPPAILTAYRTRVKREGGPGGSITKLTHAQEAKLIEKAFVDAFEEVDKAYLINARKKDLRDGSTGVVALVSHGFEVPVAATTAASLWPPEKDAAKQIGTVARAPGGVAKLFVAWCGDSRGVLLRGRQGLRCTEDHRPNRRDEQNRIKAAGGMIAQDSRGIWRVGPRQENKYAKELDRKKKGSAEGRFFLSTSRSFGDPSLKAPDPIVIASPDVKVIDLIPEDWAVVIGSDGIFDALTDQGVADVLWKAMAINGQDPVAAAKEVVQAAFKGGSKDNLTAVVMRLGWAAPPTAESAASTVSDAPEENMFG